MKLGIYTFAELTSGAVSPEERLPNLMEEIELAVRRREAAPRQDARA